MLRRLRRQLSYANVMSTLAVFFALAGGTAVALDGSNTVFGDDIVDNQVSSADVRDDNLGFGGLSARDLVSGSVGSSEIAPFSINEGDIATAVISSRHINNGTLNDEDVGQGTFVNFDGNIGSVPAHDCVDRQVTGVNARLDHALLTPDWNNADGELFYSVLYSSQTGTGEGFVMIRVCNPTAVAQNDGTTRFNLLVFDAQ